MSPNPDQSFNGQRLQWLEGLIDTPHPAGHLSRTVDVVRLHVLSEAILEKMSIMFKTLGNKGRNISVKAFNSTLAVYQARQRRAKQDTGSYQVN